MIKTLATYITKETYPIAVACLPAGFATIPVSDVLGKVLVLNEIASERMEGEGCRPFLVIANSWMSEKSFDKLYQFVDVVESHPFSEVTRK